MRPARVVQVKVFGNIGAGGADAVVRLKVWMLVIYFLRAFLQSQGGIGSLSVHSPTLRALADSSAAL